MLSGPTFRFKVGRVVEIAHTSGQAGYLIAHFKKPRRGDFFTLITRVFDAPLPDDRLNDLCSEPSTTVWLNTYQLLAPKGVVTFRHRGDLLNYSAPIPAFWFGQPECFVTIEEPNGNTRTISSPLSEVDFEREMELQGVIHSVLWLPVSIGDYLFSGIPLRWSAHKTF